MNKKLAILIVEDHDTIVSGLKYELFDKYKEIEIITKNNTSDAFKICRKKEFDIAIIDISFKNEFNSDGIDLVSKIKHAYPKTKIISYSSFANRIEYIEQLKLAKVDAIISKMDGNFDVKYAIDELLQNNGNYYSNEVLNAINQAEKSLNKQIIISRREKELLFLLRKHFKYREIANKLCVSKNTIDTHAKNLFKKFNAHRISELIEKTKDYKF